MLTFLFKQQAVRNIVSCTSHACTSNDFTYKTTPAIRRGGDVAITWRVFQRDPGSSVSPASSDIAVKGEQNWPYCCWSVKHGERLSWQTVQACFRQRTLLSHPPLCRVCNVTLQHSCVNVKPQTLSVLCALSLQQTTALSVFKCAVVCLKNQVAAQAMFTRT